MNLTDIFQPETKLRHADQESVIVGNKTLIYPDGAWLPPHVNASGDKKVGPLDPTLYATASIATNDLGLARLIMSGKTGLTYECNDKALNRATAVNMNKFRYRTTLTGGCVVPAIAFVPGQELTLQPYVALSVDNWKLTNVVLTSVTRFVYAKVVAIDANNVTIETIQPKAVVYGA